INRIPMPPNSDGTGKVWRTYTNSTFVKPVNIWPVYTDYQDIQAQAEAVWKTAMPDWDHVGVLSDVIITWGGAMHCVSRNIPEGVMHKWIPDGTCESGACSAPENGFTGDCKKNDDCQGPDWLCKCNDCSSGCVAPVNKCGGVTYDGCCTLEGILKYCENNTIKTVDCGSWDKCGWDQNNSWYDCDFSGEGPDGFPKTCPGEGPCGDVPADGVCDGDVLKWCQDAKVNETDCAADDMTCGEDSDQKPACVCKDACVEKEAQCLDYPGGRSVCREGEDGCLRMVSDPCDAGFECQEGQCVAQPQPDVVSPEVGFPDSGSADTGAPDQGAGADIITDGMGGGRCSAGTTPASPWTAMLLLPLLFLVAVRRRV
ncbi:MAG: hypothetical protein GXP54_12385, partial [Deltaproteobacteria bacterium]|nr:hypothetical protein [Deltaproteobacteria bacterium]